MYILMAGVMIIMPGVDFILVTKNTLSHGTKAGHSTILGIVTGLTIWTLVAILGLATIVAQSTVLFSLIKYLGTAYLIFIGIKSFKSKGNLSVELENPENRTSSTSSFTNQYKTSFLQGFLSDVLNPKTVIVYMTLMPQFIDTSRNVYFQLSMLGAILIFGTILWFLCVVHILNHIRVWFKKPKFQSIFNKVTGIMLVSLAMKLAFEKS
ncbi:LysE family translocator [Priestia aryabhattai]|uniref:LysE family translocator n=2 Tax=Priestia TaxID=2800373 RepID=UPI003D296DE2